MTFILGSETVSWVSAIGALMQSSVLAFEIILLVHMVLLPPWKAELCAALQASFVGFAARPASVGPGLSTDPLVQDKGGQTPQGQASNSGIHRS